MKTIANTDFLHIDTLKTIIIFDILEPKWCPDFLWRDKKIRSDIITYHTMRGRKHSLLSPSCLSRKQRQRHLSTAGEARSFRALTRRAGSATIYRVALRSKTHIWCHKMYGI